MPPLLLLLLLSFLLLPTLAVVHGAGVPAAAEEDLAGAGTREAALDRPVERAPQPRRLRSPPPLPLTDEEDEDTIAEEEDPAAVAAAAADMAEELSSAMRCTRLRRASSCWCRRSCSS